MKLDRKSQKISIYAGKQKPKHIMKQDELKEIKEVLHKIHKTLLYVFWIIGFFALLYFCLLTYLSF